ncbi:MAG: hypothetical protein WKG00_18095 [Polyangiaceae bacterium]
MGRFLLRTQIDGQPAVAPIFPPGWPAVRSLGFRAGAPMAIGPLLAAALCVPTWAIARGAARALVAAGGVPAARAALIAPVAVSLSVVCAALRYHTADTMAHGLAALCWSGAVAGGWASMDPGLGRGRQLGSVAVAGLCAGWLCATRPTSALALVALAAVVLLAQPASRRRACLLPLGVALAAAVPGVVLLLAHQRALTGSLGGSSQLAYYAVADGPRGCFRYGFGAGIGCLGEHGDFVRARLGDGFGALAAAGTTLRRLKQHLIDAGNLEPLALLVPLAVALGWRARAALARAGGGASDRGLRSVLLRRQLPGRRRALLRRRAAHRARPAGVCGGLPRRALAGAGRGAAVAGGRVVARLRGARRARPRSAARSRGGRPMFEPAVVADLAPEAMLFLDTDHGFALAARPAAPHAVARRRGDALDFMAWDAAGRPPAFAYHYDPAAAVAAPTLAPLDFAAAPGARWPAGAVVIEGESLWPPRSQLIGHALPVHAAGTCASGGRWLELVRGARADAPAGQPQGYPELPGLQPVLDEPEPTRVVVEVPLPAPWMHGMRVTPVLAIEGRGWVTVVLTADGRPAGFVRDARGSEERACLRLQGLDITKQFTRIGLQIAASLPDAGSRVALDAVILEDVGPPGPAGDPSKSR